MAPLRIVNLDKHFGSRSVLRSVDIEVPPGDSLVLFGPSGCGKTTLLRILAGLDDADAGEVHFDERRLSGPDVCVPPEGRGIGMVFQDLALWPHMSVEGHLDFVLKQAIPSKRLRRARVEELLARYGLMEHRRARPYRLSGGEQQRLAFARAFAEDRPLMLLDEPFSHLDAAWRAKLVEDILCRKRDGATFVVATHQKDDVRALGDHVLAFRPGGAALISPGEFEEAYAL